MFTLKTAALVKQAIAHVSRTAGVYSMRVQEAAVHCIGHAIAHGDVTLATDLVNAVRKHDKAIIVAFFEQNGPFAWDKQLGFRKNKDWQGSFTPESIPNWENAKKPIEPKSMYDVDEALDRFLKTVQAQIAKAQTVKNRELLAFVEEAQASYNSLRAKEAVEAAKARAEQ